MTENTSYGMSFQLRERSINHIRVSLNVNTNGKITMGKLKLSLLFSTGHHCQFLYTDQCGSSTIRPHGIKNPPPHPPSGQKPPDKKTLNKKYMLMFLCDIYYFVCVFV